MYITGHKVYNGQHQNMSWHHPSFLRKKMNWVKGKYEEIFFCNAPNKDPLLI